MALRCASSMNRANSLLWLICPSRPANSVPTGLVMAAWMRGFWRRMPASNVEPARGRPEMKWMPCCIHALVILIASSCRVSPPVPGNASAAGGPLPARLPRRAQAGDDCVVVGAAADLAVVAQVYGGGLGDGGAGREADDGAVARRRGAVDGEGVARRAGEGGADRPAGVIELVQPAQPQRKPELPLAAQRQFARQLGAQCRAQRVGALLGDVEAERVGA